MDDELTRFWTDLIGRLTGPLSFRVVLQPSMAILLAVRDGVKDAREGRPAYFWGMLTRPSDRRRLVRDGMTATARIILLGVVMDLIYQVIVSHTVRVFELIVVVLLLAFVPYLLTRGTVNRIARALRRSGKLPTP